ncbi:MAG: ABC transporter permease, partial [Anaerolineales bacterium]|nr:ABC transporter permease [Anaerolineales bacterium]
LGVGLFISALAVFFADIVDIYQVVLTILLYSTPIFYPIEIVPQEFLPILNLNPMTCFVQIFRLPIHRGSLPELDVVLWATVIALFTFGIGWWFFSRKAGEFAYRV